METEQIIGILSSAGASVDDRSLDTLEARFVDLPQTPAEAFEAVRGVRVAGVDFGALIAGKGGSFVHAFLSGVRSARESAKSRVNQLRQFPIVPKNPHVPDRASALTQLRQSYDDLAARNRTVLTQVGAVR